ncbi:hypothetical protein MOX02_60150 [Methylobacterium oxalidis]|uniref:Uncharacterized protein n=1 Tax=Methylobacterium oxalidis TaxID=944322 RepID=A0A512JDJ2_9HYPH|nr:hypothetical protein MOX02_60150 [Methylobacterium oxalidis]GLS64514.1 hypothetical protein GCM10007888_28950 [Methylobacterium oxalidis]
MSYCDPLAQIEERFAVADGAWAREVEYLYGGNPYLHHDKPSGRGEPDSALRLAYEARERAFAAWCSARGLDTVT